MTTATIIDALNAATARRTYEAAKCLAELLSVPEQFTVIDAAIAARRRLLAAGVW